MPAKFGREDFEDTPALTNFEETPPSWEMHTMFKGWKAASLAGKVGVAIGCLVLLVCVAAPGHAQKAKRKHRPQKVQVKQKSAPRAERSSLSCYQRVVGLSQVRNELAAYEAAVAGIDGEVRALQERLTALQGHKEALAPKAAQRNALLEQWSQEYSRHCDASCADHEVLASGLAATSSAAESLLRQIRSEVSLTEGQALQLQGRIERNAKSLANLDCSPQSSRQLTRSDLEQCSKSLGEWLQISWELTRLQTEIPKQRRRFEEAYISLQRLLQASQSYLEYMQPNCSNSLSLHTLQSYAATEKLMSSVQKQLTSLEDLFGKLGKRYLDVLNVAQ